MSLALCACRVVVFYAAQHGVPRLVAATSLADEAACRVCRHMRTMFIA